MFANNFVCFEDDGRIVAASLGMAKLLGYSTRRAFLTQSPNVFHLCDTSAHADQFRQHLEEALPSDYVTLRVRCCDGTRKELLLSVRKRPYNGLENPALVRYEGFAEEISENNASMMLLLTTERIRKQQYENNAEHPVHGGVRHKDEVMPLLSEILNCVAAYARLIEGGAREHPELVGMAHEIVRAAEHGIGVLGHSLTANVPHSPQISFSIRQK